MDENSTPPAGETPPDPASGQDPTSGHDQASGPQPGQQYGQQYGPRVSGADIRDVSRLRRSVTDRHIAGVAGGLARHLDVDPILVRVGFVVFTLFGGAGLLLYGALWLLVPEEDEQAAPINLDPRSRSVALLVVGVIAALSFIGNVFGGWGGNHDGFLFFPLIPLAIVGYVAYVVLRRRERRQAHFAAQGGETGQPAWAAAYAAGPAAGLKADAQANPEKYRDVNAWQVTGDPRTGYRWVRDPRKKGPLLFWIALPLIALALGVLGTVDLAGTHVIAAAYPALALTVVAVLLLLGSFWGRAGGLILLGLLLVPVTAVATAADHWEGEDVRYTPTSAAELPADGEYHLDLGKMVVDLTQIDPAALDGRRITAGVDVGEVEVIVPDNLDVDATARVEGPGGLELFGEEGGGIDISNHRTQDVPEEAGHLTVSASADLGHVIVRSK